MQCKRSMDCTCPECAAASAQFSVEDLKQFSSTINYGEDGSDFSTAPAESTESQPKPAARPKIKRKPPSRPTSSIQRSAAPSAPRPPEIAVRSDPDDLPAVPQSSVPALPQSSVPTEKTQTEAAGEDIGDGPSEESLVSKDWKERKAAYGTVLDKFRVAQPQDEVFAQYASFLKGMAQDSNAACLDVALEALLVFADVYSNAAEYAPEVAPAVITKGFAGRPGTVSRAEDALLKLMEVDTPDVVVGALLEGLSDKKPKVPPACVSIITKAFELFGPRVMPVKDIKAAIPGMLSHKVIAVRQQGLGLAAEIISWCGEAILTPVLSDLRSAQKSELDNLVQVKAEASSGPRAPTLYLRKDRSKADKGGGEGAQPATGAPAFDPREFMEAVDILTKLPKTEFNQKLSATKWSEILEGLNIAVEMIGPVPKLAAGDYGDLVQRIKRLGDHSHVQVATTAHRLLGLLAEGLGQGFQPFCKSVIGAMLIKLKDKKCVAAIGACLDKVYGNPYSLDQVVDEAVAALDSKKAAHARVATLEWISRCTARSKPTMEPGTLATLSRTTIRLVDDSDPKIREVGSSTMAAIANASRGPKGVAPQIWASIVELQTSNPRAFKRIRDQVESNGSEQKIGNNSSTTTTETETTSATGKRSQASIPTAQEKPPASSRGGASKSAPTQAASTRPRKTVRGTGSTAPSKGKAAPTAAPSASNRGADRERDDGDETPTLTPEEAMQQLESVGIPGWQDSILPGLSGTAWKEKVAAIERISDGLVDDGGSHVGAMVLVLAGHTKQFKDSNFNVLKAAFAAIINVLEKAAGSSLGKANRAAVAVVLSPSVEKLGDRKLQETCSSLLTSAAEALGPSWVCRRVVKAAGGAKAPLVHSEALGWLQGCVEDFGAASVPAVDLVAFVASELEHVNPKVRSSALDLLGSLFHRLGPPLKAFLPELRPALQSQVEDTFKKVGYDPTANAQTRRVGTASGDQEGEGAPAGGGGGGLPRMDLSTLLEKDCLTRVQCTKGKDSWKGRKAAMEEVIQACAKSGNHLEANKFIVEVLKALTPRLADSQSNLKPLAAGAIAEVASSIPPDASAKVTRVYAEPLLACVADNRKMMRDAAIAALEKVSKHGGEIHVPTLDALVGPIVVALANIVGRIELLTWLKTAVRVLPSGEGPSSLVSPLLACMQDKNAGARQLAQDCLSGLVAAGIVQPSRLIAATRDFQPAVMRQLKPALDKILENQASAGVTDTESASAVNNANTKTAAAKTAAAAPPVVSKLTRSGHGSVGAPGVQNKRSSQRAEPTPEGDETSTGASGAGLALVSSNTKAKRLDLERRTRWVVSSDEPRDFQTSSLKTLWSPLLRQDAVGVLFPTRAGSMECGVAGMDLLSDALRVQHDAFMDQLDLVLKWITLRLCEKENVKAMSQLMQFVGNIFDALVERQYRLEDQEADILLPTLLEKSGQAKERFRLAMRGLLAKIPQLCSYAKYSPLLFQAMNSKNSRTRIVCLLELSRCIESDGAAGVLGKKGLKELARHVDSDQAEVRSAALDAVESCYVSLGMDSARIHRWLGPVSDKTKTLVEERMKAVDRKANKSASAAGATNARESRDGHPSPRANVEHREEGSPVSSAPVEVFQNEAFEEDANTPFTPLHLAEADADSSEDYRASLGGLGTDTNAEDLRPTPIGHFGGEDGVPLFQFDCNELEVVLSPRSRQQESGRTTSEKTFWTLMSEIESGLLRRRSLVDMSAEEHEAAVDQIKGLSSWAAAQSLAEGDNDLLSKHHSRLMETLVQCLRVSFTGSAPVDESDFQYAEVPGTGGIDLELAPQVVTALDDVCTASPRLFGAATLATLLREVCGWLVAQRVGPSAIVEQYKKCDPNGQVQQKLNRIASMCGSADPTVAIVALLHAMAAVLTESAKQEVDQVPVRDGRLVHAKILKVYVKLLGRLLAAMESNRLEICQQGQNAFEALSLPLVLRALHTYHIADYSRGVLAGDVNWGKALDGATSAVATLCTRLLGAWGGSAIVRGINQIRAEPEGCVEESRASSEAWQSVIHQFLVDESDDHTLARHAKTVESSRRQSSPSLPVQGDHVAEIAGLIGLVSAESQSVRDGVGEDHSWALNELKTYLQKWPEAQATLEDQAHRLNPRFRQFILSACADPAVLDSGSRVTLLRGRHTPDVHGTVPSVRRRQEFDSARKSLAFEADENDMRPAVGSLDLKDEGLPSHHSNRLQEIRRRMGGLGGRDAGLGGPRVGMAGSESGSSVMSGLDTNDYHDTGRPQPFKLNNTRSTADIQERLRASRLHMKSSDIGDIPLPTGVPVSRPSLAERLRRRNG